MQRTIPAGLTISEFAKLAETTRSKLLYYDKLGIFSPVNAIPRENQAPNRIFAPEQLIDYHMIELLSDAGLSLTDSFELRNSSMENRHVALQKSIESIDAQIERLQHTRAMLTLMDRINALADSSEPTGLTQTTLDEPLRFRSLPVENGLTRNMNRYVHVWADAFRTAKADASLLPAPIGHVYAAGDVNGFFPVRALLIPKAVSEPDDLILPAGRYVIVWGDQKPGSWQQVGYRTRDFLRENRLKRTSPIIGFTLSMRIEEGRAIYSECYFCSVTDGETPEGERPVAPGVED